MMMGNLIELQFGQGRNWPLGAALSLTLLAIVMAVPVFVRVRRVEGWAAQPTSPGTSERWLPPLSW